MANVTDLRKNVTDIFKLNGFTMRIEARDFLVETLMPLSVQERSSWIEKVIDHCRTQPLSSDVLGKQQLETAILDSCKNEIDEEDDLLKIVNAFDVPKFFYNFDRKKFLPAHSGKTNDLFSAPTRKGILFRDRYTLIHQRTMRNKLFHGAANDSSQFKLRPIEFFLSTANKKENVVLLGMLSQLKEGRYFLEDPSGIVQLDLSNSTYHDGLFADSCFVLVEGTYQDEIFYVDAIGLPPKENSAVSRVYFGTADSFGGSETGESVKNSERLKCLEQKRDDVMLVFLSDIWLDQQNVLDKLKSLFIGYNIAPPTAFIFMGNFLSEQKGSQHLSALKEGFKSLGDVIAFAPNVAKCSKFIIIPGPTDSPAANILPRPPLSDHLLQDLKPHVRHLIPATNPCRISYCTQEIVLIRENLVTKLCRNSIHFPALNDIGLHFAKTIICQAHLVPLSLNVCPVYWDFDAALRLYPCPDLIVVGDQQKSFSASYNNCQVINPSSFSRKEFAFKVYYPASKEVEDCHIPDAM